MAKNISTMTRKSSSTGATICLDAALRLEAKLLQPVHAQGQLGNLIFRVGPQCSDRLFNPGFGIVAPQRSARSPSSVAMRNTLLPVGRNMTS
jgi:hypothetical protein